MDTLLTFGEWIEDLYLKRYGDQTAFADAVGVGQSTVSSWVNHKRPPSRRNRVRIAVALDVPVDEVSRRVVAQIWLNDDAESGVSEPKEVKAAQKRGKVSLLAGVPASATQWVDIERQGRMIELPEDWLRDVRSPAKAVTVNGDCLVSRGIFNGDLVICESVLDPMSPPQNKVVLVRIGDEYTLKVWHWIGAESAELRDGNGAVIATLSIGDDFEVLGVARKRWGDVL